MRTTTASEDLLYESGHYSVDVRVRIRNADGDMVDYSDHLGYNWIRKVTVRDGVDENAAEAMVELIKRRSYDNLAPFFQNTRPNTLSNTNTYGAAVDLSRTITIDTRIKSDQHDTAGTWRRIFDGYVDDVDSSGSVVKVLARDRSLLLIDQYCETVNSYVDRVPGESPRLIESIIQEVIDDHIWPEIGGVLEPTPALYTPTSPGWAVADYENDQSSIMDNILRLSDQIGWLCRYKWRESEDEFQLTLFTVDRSKVTPDHTFGPSDYIDISTLRTQLTTIRNVCTVRYINSSGEVQSETSADAASISTYGRRFCGVTEAASSLITSSTEAVALASAIVSDLSAPEATHVTEHPYIHFVEYSDLYRFEPNGEHYDIDLDLSVVEYEHSFEAGKMPRTTLTCRAAAPVGGMRRWHGQIGTSYGPTPQDDAGPVVEIDESQIGTNIGGLEIKVKDPRVARNVETYQLHAGPTSDFVTSASTVVSTSNAPVLTAITGTSNGIPIGEQTYVKVVAVDTSGNKGPDSAAVAVTAAQHGPASFDTTDRIMGGGTPGSTFGTQTRGTAYPPDGFDMVVGTWGTAAVVDDGSVYGQPITGASYLRMETDEASEVASKSIPVAEGRRYQARMEFQSDSSTHKVTMTARWLDASKALISAETLFDAAADDADTFQQVRATLCPIPGARFCAISVAKTSASYQVAVDELTIDELGNGLDEKLSTVEWVEDWIPNSTSGLYGWETTQVGGAQAVVTKQGTTTAAFGRGSEQGILRIQTPATAGGGSVVHLGDSSGPAFSGLPPIGYEQRHKLRVDIAGLDHSVYAGLAADETIYPDDGAVNAATGIFIVARGPNWLGIVRNGTSETPVSLGITADNTWRDLGFIMTSNGVRFTEAGRAIGDEVTTNLPGSTTGLFPVLGAVSLTGVGGDHVDCDYIGAHGQTRRAYAGGITTVNVTMASSIRDSEDLIGDWTAENLSTGSLGSGVNALEDESGNGEDAIVTNGTGGSIVSTSDHGDLAKAYSAPMATGDWLADVDTSTTPLTLMYVIRPPSSFVTSATSMRFTITSVDGTEGVVTLGAPETATWILVARIGSTSSVLHVTRGVTGSTSWEDIGSVTISRGTNDDVDAKMLLGIEAVGAADTSDPFTISRVAAWSGQVSESKMQEIVGLF